MRFTSLLLSTIFATSLASQSQPLQVGVIGLTHTHVHWIFGSAKQTDVFQIAGIVEPNRELAKRYVDQYDYPMERIYNSSQELIKAQELDAVTAFGTIYDHLEIVETFAPLGIHVMVEKPLAVSLEHAKRMYGLAKKHNIHLLTNYETTWYPTNHKAYEIIKADSIIGGLRKIVVRDGHKGPKKIGVDPEFLEWLTDPIQNGGGAVTDFGCYGANLLTWIMDGQKPNSVTAITTQQQPQNNQKVDDEAIIILQYDTTVAIIQASWNWPIGRKDMEVYGVHGAIYADNRNDLRLRIPTGYDTFTEDKMKLPERAAPLNDPFTFLAGVINGEIAVPPTDLSALENNMTVMEILDAAIRSAREGKTISLNE